MNRALLCLAVLATALIPAFGAGVEDQVVAAEKSWAKAVMTGDAAALDKLLAPDLIYAHSTGVVESKTEYLGKLKSGSQKYDLIDHEKTTVKVHGNAAVAHSVVVMRGTNASGPFNNKLMMMHLWVKEGAMWRLAAHQTTRLTQ
jgi:ketosteroid isomerase-like protein